tara:strand:- start:1427 stop:1666 length:240 start_codon:yes stop_codon:yes gene_type:complete
MIKFIEGGIILRCCGVIRHMGTLTNAEKARISALGSSIFLVIATLAVPKSSADYTKTIGRLTLATVPFGIVTFLFMLNE